MGRTPTEDQTTPGRSDSSGPAGPHPLPTEWAIEKISLHSRNARNFGDWLDTWKQLQNAGWDVTVTTSNHGNAVGFGYNPATIPKPTGLEP